MERDKIPGQSEEGTAASSPLTPDPLNIHYFQLHACQWEVFHSAARFRVLVAGRRFGKTELAVAEMLRASKGKNKRIYYVAPNDAQSKRIIWDRLKTATQPFWAKTPNETDLRIDVRSGSIIIVTGGYVPKSLRGDGIDFLVLDEYATMKPEIWRKVFRPALADRQGRVLFLGTPCGRNHFYDCYQLGQEKDPEWESRHFTTEQGGIVTKAELASAARDLDADSYRQEFEAEFTGFGQHRAYSSFDRAVNVKDLDFDGMYSLGWSIDFNVDPMCMLLVQRFEDHAHVIDEIIIRPNANTELACAQFLKRAKPLSDQVPPYQRPLKVHIYGDASGNQRHTAGSSTDWALIKDFFRMWVGTFVPIFHVKTSNPQVKDRVNCVNTRLRNRHGDCRLFVDTKCKELIHDLEEVSWTTDSAGRIIYEIDKSDRNRTHASDALGYFIHEAYPLTPPAGEQGNRLCY